MAVFRRYVVSHAQRDLWSLQKLVPESAAYNVVSAWRIRSRVDDGALAEALVEMANRHDALRTTYRERDGAVWAEVHDRVDGLRLVDARGTTDAELMLQIADEAHRPFDLKHGPVFRPELFTISHDDHVLVLMAHRIVGDGWSLRIFMKELGLLYDAHAAGRSPVLPPAGASCEEFSRWQAEMLGGPEGERLWAFWRKELAGELPRLDLPTDRLRKRVRRHRGAAETVTVDGQLATAVLRLARGNGTTPFVVLLVTFQALLARYTGQDDIVVGSVAHGRTIPRFRRTVGALMNPIVLRADLSDEPNFMELAHRARETVQAALAHQNYPFPLLVKQLAADRDPRRSPLCDVAFGLAFLSGEAKATLTWGRFTLTALPVPRQASQRDLEVQLAESADGMTAVFQYDADLFDPATIRRMGRHYLRMIEAFGADPTRRISEVPLRSDMERARLIAGWAGASIDRDRSERVEALVEAQVDRAPDTVAVCRRTQRLTYRQLDERANQLAHRLRRLGIGPDMPVGICVHPSPDLVVGLLGILKAGGAYVPLDPWLPLEDLAFAVQDAGARALVTEERYRSLVGASAIPTVSLDGDAVALEGEPTGRLVPAEAQSDRDRAYIIYMSPSTGVPKGVEVEHRGVVNAVRDVATRLRLGPTDVWTAVAPVTSDDSALEIWGPLGAGARLELLESTAVGGGERLGAALRAAGSTVMLTKPTLWRTLLDSGWAGQPELKMISRGETLSRDLADELLQRGSELWNQYGTTETTICVTAEQVVHDDSAPTIGRPIRNARVYVLDVRGEPVPVGVAGQLWVAGVQVARGYLNRREETDRAFGADPRFPGERRYRTGDFARVRSDGRIEYLGRLDGRIKVGGYRVDVEEIERALETHPAVRSAAVLGAGNGTCVRDLTAYVIAPDPQLPPTAEDLRVFLRARFPDHMVPSGFKLLDSLPRTPSGKIDRRALASAELKWLDRGTPFVAARTGLEQMIARIWAEVLDLPLVGVNDPFFELGGDSLLATQVVSRIREALGIDLPLRHLFETPTVAALAGRFADAVGEGRAARRAMITPQVDHDPAPLSFSQQRSWFLHRLAPESPAYNAPAAMRIRGGLNSDALAAALRAILSRHEILRTVFPAMDGRPMQRVTEGHIDLTIVDLQSEPESERRARARDILRTEARRPFDLTQGPVVRAHLIRLDASDHVFLINMHHIVCDNWSFGILCRELIALYNASVAGRPAGLPPVPIQFADFACWQRERLSQQVLDAHLAYWRSHLGATLPVLDLPTDRPRPSTPSYEGRRETRRLSRTLVAAIDALSRQERASVFMTLVAAVNALLARYCGRDDILLGVPIANRNHLALEGLIGNLVNTLPVLTNLSGDPTFRELLRRVRATLLDAYDHQEMPFDTLVQKLHPERYTSHSPLIQVLVNLPNAPMPRERLEHLTWEAFEIDCDVAQFDLTFSFDWDPDGCVTLDYSTDQFELATVARMIAHFETLLKAAVADPDRRLSEIPLLRPVERHQLLVAWNRTAAPISPTAAIDGLFEAQANRTPDAVAVTDREGSLTYRELDVRANQLAHHLRLLGVRQETIVGVCLERSAWTFVAFLGVLKAGAAFLPLDPGYPPERLVFMMTDSAAAVLITDRRHVPEILPAGVRTVLLDAHWPTIVRQSDARPSSVTAVARLAYVVYTSASTGSPKGVLATHRGAVNRFRWMWRTYPFAAGEVCCQKTSTSFVDCIWEIFGPLLHGVPTVVIPDEVVREPRLLIRTLATYRVTRIVLVPSLLSAMLEADPELGARLPHLRLWASSGEALGRDLVRRFRQSVPHGVLLNLYGSSEAAGDSTFHEVGDADAAASIPIGRPIDNTAIYILDPNRQPVPVGVAGELYIGGDGLADGYLNRPDLTVQRFVHDPFNGRPGARMYRTGDLARYRSNGVIEYLGRLDSQVKIRGYRIELGEVESALTAHPDVTMAVAVAREQETRDRRLVGYVVAREGAVPADILEFVRRRLPAYMVPSALVLLDTLPLTPNGKVDRRALPAPRTVGPEATERPRTATEAALAGIWADLLGLPEVGVNENFFELGGYSLLAARLVAKIEDVFRATLPLRVLFEAPTVAHLAALIDASSPAYAGWSAR